MEVIQNPQSRRASSHMSRIRSGQQTPGQVLSNANSFDLTRKTLFTDKDILKTVLRFVDFEDLLRARLVNNFWNEIICANPLPKLVPSATVFWPKVRLAFPKRTAKGGKHEIGKSSIESFENLSLVRKFHCPNYRFHRVDLRKEKVQLFFISFGQYIRHLTLDNCVMSLVTFQRIVNKCPNMESFDVTGLFHCITMTESLCAIKEAHMLCSFANLRSLCLESTYVRRMILNLTCKDPSKRYHVSVQELNSLVIHELLTSAKQLEWIRISGFGQATIIGIMQTLVSNPIHTKLTALEFYDICNGMDSKIFRELARELSHVKLRTFALTFLVGNLARTVSNEGTNMDSAIQEVLQYHGSTLEEVDLTHCHVTEKIFNSAARNMKLPNLKTLILKGTKISKLSKATSQVMPDLEYHELTGEDTTAQETNEMVGLASREEITHTILQEHKDFGFHIFSLWDKVTFVALGICVLYLIYYLLVDAFRDAGKPVFAVVASLIFVMAQVIRLRRRSS